MTTHKKCVYDRYTYRDILKDTGVLAHLTHQQSDEKNPNRKFTFIDLFAGIGGIRQAFEGCGGQCLFSSEIDVHAKYTYYTNFGSVPYGDIMEIDAHRIPDHDVLCGGFPCQPFSRIGKREGFDHATQGTMFHEIVRILKVKKPRVVFLENVPGIINHDGGNTLQVIVDSLQELGYVVYQKVLDAQDFGVPQQRKRFYLVAVTNPNKKFNFPRVCKNKEKVDIGPFIEKNIEKYSISKHLQESYLFKVDDGKPDIIDQTTTGVVKTLLSSYHKIQRLTGTFVRDGETGIRLLSKKECLSIMGFPADFVIPVSRTQMYRQLGNSVVIPVIDAIASQIAQYLIVDCES